MQSFSRGHLLSRLPTLAGVCVLTSLLSNCTGVTKRADVVVSVKDQKLGLYQEGQLKKTYKISTSKFGLGDRPGSNCTPLGQHQVVAKIGHGLPAGAVLKSRRWNGEVLKPNAPGRDPIVSRILWLKGTELDNRHAYNRFIYIHGTPEENRLGQPASYGCVRMGMKDVVNVFDSVNVGAKVMITKGALPKGEAPPKPPVEADVAAGEPPVDDKAMPIEIAKLEGDPKEKANAEKNEKAKAKVKSEEEGAEKAKDGPEKAKVGPEKPEEKAEPSPTRPRSLASFFHRSSSS